MKNLTIISSGTSPGLSKSSSSSSLNTSQSTYRSAQSKQTASFHLEPTRTLNNVNDNLQQIHKQIQAEILKQLLKLKNISFDWFDVILPLAWKCVDLVKPDVKHDNDFMDIRNYVKIKKLPGSSKQDCKIVNGLVFTKNVAHKQMKQEMKTPKILLFRSSIEYQRSEEKMCSLEPIFTAESQYLKNHCSKLLLRQNPDILIVEKSVARLKILFFFLIFCFEF
jgi:1-phosphatidylinositol-3-phosphate 5-kinase